MCNGCPFSLHGLSSVGCLKLKFPFLPVRLDGICLLFADNFAALRPTSTLPDDHKSQWQEDVIAVAVFTKKTRNSIQRP